LEAEKPQETGKVVRRGADEGTEMSALEGSCGALLPFMGKSGTPDHYGDLWKISW
jgi:hypothetical protein